MRIQAINHHYKPMNYHLINRIDDGIQVVIQLPQQLNNIASASPEDWGRTIEKIVRVTLATVVFITVVILDIATLMYQAGHAFGQFVHSLNDKLTNFTRSVMLWCTKDDQCYSLDDTTCCVRKSTQTQPTINSWQLQLPLSILSPKLNSFVYGSSDTTTTVNTQEHQLSSHCTKHGLDTEDQRKEAITTNVVNLSKASVSSARSRRSVQRSSSSRKPRKPTEATGMSLDGPRTESALSKDGLSGTRRSARTTAKKPQH